MKNEFLKMIEFLIFVVLLAFVMFGIVVYVFDVDIDDSKSEFNCTQEECGAIPDGVEIK